MKTVEAPFTAEQVENLNRFQGFGMFHPFTCGKAHDDPRRLEATEAGWRCTHEGCDYTQGWAHEGMAGFTQAEADKLREHYRARGFKV